MEQQSDNQTKGKSEGLPILPIEERQLPIVLVGDHQFKIDIANGELRHVEDPLLTIAFHAMVRESNRFSFLYDYENDKFVLDKNQHTSLTGREYIQLPSMEKLDPEFNRKMEQEEATVMKMIREGTSVYNTGLDQYQSKGPLLPIVNFYGTDFFLDLRLKEFREVADPNNSIRWNALQSEDFHHTLFYDAQTKNAYQGPSASINEPNVKFLYLPPLDIMIRDGVQRHQKMLDAKQDNDKVIHVKVTKKRNFRR